MNSTTFTHKTMNNKKLIFIVGVPRSGTTLLLSFLCGIPNTKVLYETKYLTSQYLGDNNSLTEVRLKHIANYLDSFEEEIIIEKTPEHVFHLEDIEKLRKLCKRDIYVVYIVRPPVPTILSLIKASKDNPELFGHIDLQGACEKYEESLVSIYNNLVLKTNRYNSYKIVGEDGFVRSEIPIPYSFCITYRDLIDNPLGVIRNLKNYLLLNINVQSLIDNRITNTRKYLPIVTTEKHHVNVLREIEEVEVERNEQIYKEFSDTYVSLITTIRNYFEDARTKQTIYDLVINKKVLEVDTNPLVNIIIPLFNKENYIRETLTSILNQTYTNYVCYIVDDGSTDSSRERVYEFFESLPMTIRNVKFVLIPMPNNRGVSEARNIAIKWILSESDESDIISFCDADDIWNKELVQKSVDTFIKYPHVDCVYSRVIHKKDNEYELDKSKICDGNVFKDAIKFNFLTCGSNLFVRKRVLEENNIEFDLSFSGCEDWDFLIQLSKVAMFKCTKEYLVTYRYVPNSLSSNRKDQVDMGRTILKRYVEDSKEYSRTFTRLFLYYFSTRNLTKENLKDLDYRFILEVILDKFKSYVKSYLPKIS